MTRRYWLKHGQTALVGFGIVVGTLVAKHAADSGWWVMAGPGLLALSVVCADLLEARLRHERPVPSFGVLILASTFLVAGFVVALRGSDLGLLVPVIGGVCWIGVLSRSDRSSRSCRYL